MTETFWQQQQKAALVHLETPPSERLPTTYNVYNVMHRFVRDIQNFNDTVGFLNTIY